MMFATAAGTTQPPIGTVAMYLGDVADVRRDPNAAWQPCQQDAPEPVQAAAVGDAGAVLLEAQGWMVCDGRSLRVSQCASLYAVLGTRYGAPEAGTFCLPDLRGVFVRGVDAGAGVDPDAGARRSPTGSGSDAGVGSLQCDALQTHTHTYSLAAALTAGSAEGPAFDTNQDSETSTPNAARTSSETRPRNVAVYYIIRYR